MKYKNRPEISDLIVQYDDSGQRIPVCRSEAIEQCISHYARTVIEKIPHQNDVLCNDAVDDLLIRSHCELQRLWEEFFHAQRVAKVIESIVTALRTTGLSKTFKLVDVGCGTGYVLRWLATRGRLAADSILVEQQAAG